MNRFIKLLLAISACTLITQAYAQGAEAGKVLLSLGDVKVIRASKEIALKKGDAVQSGDVIITGPTSNAQVRMSDGAVIAIRAQTEFKINEYKFSGKEDGTEKASLSLVKGGVRAVTGVIGRTNKDNLQVDGVVATVGIRGTGFNIVYCQGNCVNADKSPAKNGLYANVFEGKVVVKNEATNGTYGVNEPVLVESKNSAISRLREIPVFLKDPLVGQVVVPKKAESVVVPVAAAVVVPKESAANVAPATPAVATVSGVVVAVPPSLTGDNSPLTPTVYYNKNGLGEGTYVNPANRFFLQVAENSPNPLRDGLPFNTVVVKNTLDESDPLAPFYVGTWQPVVSGDSVTRMTFYDAVTDGNINRVSCSPGGASSGCTLVDGKYVTNFVYDLTAPSTATQVEGGRLNGYVSWGRWAGGNVNQVGGLNDGKPINYTSQGGFHYIIGSIVTNFPRTDSYTFNLVGATSPSLVSNPEGTWFVTKGSLTANFASSASNAISGNLAITTNQSAGFGLYNLTFQGPMPTSGNGRYTVDTTLSKQSGTLTTCTTACTGSGNVAFYGSNGTVPNAAGLSYQVNTPGNVLQGVAVFKR